MHSRRSEMMTVLQLSNMESLLISVLSSQDVSSQMDYMKENYADDVRTGYLFSQLEILKVLIKDAQINCFAVLLIMRDT